MRILGPADPDVVGWPAAPLSHGLRRTSDWIRLEAFSLIAPTGRRSILGPLAFAVAGIALLIYDHLNSRMTDLMFWLTLVLIVSVFGRVLESNRRQRLALEAHRREGWTDRVTGLPNRLRLESDLRAAAGTPGDRRALLAMEIEGLRAYQDRCGRAAAENLMRETAKRLLGVMGPLHGTAYRLDESRLAALVPASQQQLGEAVLAATALRIPGDDGHVPTGRAYGEVTIPEDAADPDLAIQLVGQRLMAHKQRQQRSARRQAHAVLIAALSSRRPELRDHLRIVAYRAISLARRLGVDGEAIDDIALAAELQDVGLLTVPEAILEKRTPLDEREIALIHRHPIEGERIVSAAAELASVANLVRSSSERFDGSGYPDRLSREAIAIGARIIAVAVSFAAMTSNRPYRPASSPDQALAELRRCAGTQFDPTVVEALAQDLVEEEGPASFLLQPGA